MGDTLARGHKTPPIASHADLATQLVLPGTPLLGEHTDMTLLPSRVMQEHGPASHREMRHTQTCLATHQHNPHRHTQRHQTTHTNTPSDKNTTRLVPGPVAHIGFPLRVRHTQAHPDTTRVSTPRKRCRWALLRLSLAPLPPAPLAAWHQSLRFCPAGSQGLTSDSRSGSVFLCFHLSFCVCFSIFYAFVSISLSLCLCIADSLPVCFHFSL